MGGREKKHQADSDIARMIGSGMVDRIEQQASRLPVDRLA